MKIAKLGSGDARAVSERETIPKSEKNSKQFALELSTQSDQYSEQRIAELLQQITKQGAKLSQTPTYAELKAYRELVRQYLGEAVGRMYTLQSSKGWDRQGRHKIFSIIKQIDDRLAEITEDIRQGQQRQLAIMEKLDSIRGMLVDLFT